MSILTYNVSPKITADLKTIDGLRSKILLAPLPGDLELRFRWEANLKRTVWSMSLAGNPLPRHRIIKLLSSTNKKRLSDYEKDVINLKKAMDYIKEEWYVSQKTVDVTTVRKLYDLACRETLGAPGSLFSSYEKDLNLFLKYLQAGQDHPVVQAGVSLIQILTISPFIEGSPRVARLLAYLFLYKYGYDIREQLVFEEYFRRDLVTYRNIRDKVKRDKNLTGWLEYFTSAVQTQLKKPADALLNLRFQHDTPSYAWKLNDRQREILLLLERPEAKISNKDVQQRFKISQITASRDLTKLSSLNLLISRGKGRSVYYTRV